jgi:DNA topoisomerase-1
VKCDFRLWQKPIKESCPVCGAKYLLMAGNKLRPMIACATKECGYKRSADSPPEQPDVLPAPQAAAVPI